MKRKWHKHNGMVYVAAVIMLAVFTSLGIGYLMMTRTELSIARNQLTALKSFYMAESAMHHSIAEILSDSDPDSDGMGNIPLTDFDGDSVMDYSATYSPGTGRISAIGQPGMGTSIKTVQAYVVPKKWTGAFQVGNRIPTVNNCDFSTVAGNVDAKSTINTNFITQHTVTGVVTANNAGLVIPTTDTGTSGPWYSYASAPNQHVNCSWVTPGSPVITGVHHVNGNCTINFSGTSPLTINGSLIVNGNLSIAQVRGLTILPAGNDPALIASGTLAMSNISPSPANITGLIYAGGNITLTSWDFWVGHTINGAIVTAAGDIALNTIARTNWVFDPDLNPPFFTGGSGIIMNSWKGHQ